MSDLERVKNLVRRTGSDGRVAPAIVEFASVEDGAAQIVTAVRSKVLATRISIILDGTASVTLDVSDRRLLRFLKPVPEGISARLADLFQSDEITPQDAPAVAQLLTTICHGKTRLEVSSTPLTEELDPTATGIGCDDLFCALGVDEPKQGAAVSDDLEALVETLKPFAHSAILIQGEQVTSISGEDGAVSDLADWTNDVLPKILVPEFPLLGTFETCGLFIFAAPTPDAHSIAVAGRLGSYVIATVHEKDVAIIISDWRNIFAT